MAATPNPKNTQRSDAAVRYVFGLKNARDERDIQFLVDALDNESDAPRAARFLVQLEAVEAIPPLRALLDSPKPHIRTAAVEALGKLRANEAAGDVSRLATSDDVQWVRSYALVALASILGQEARATLLEALTEDQDWRTRRASAVALGSVGREDDLDRLRGASKREPWWRRREYRRARRRIRQRARRG